MNRLYRWLALEPGRRRLLLAAARCLLVSRIRFIFLAWSPKLLLRVCSPGRARSFPAPSALTPEEAAEAVLTASRHLPGADNCLVRALATRRLLLEMGYAADLRVGVRRGSDGRLEAHAWVERAGKVLADGPVGVRYAPLAFL